METINPFCSLTPHDIMEVKRSYGTPVYLYDEMTVINRCGQALAMPHAYGLTVRYAMKANSNLSLLRLIHRQGLGIDASSLNEVRRAVYAGIKPNQIILTSQEIPAGQDRHDLERLMLDGLLYNVCSLRQLHLVGDFIQRHQLNLSIRIHPGIGAGESSSRNTGDEYSCFGIHQTDIPDAMHYASQKNITFTQVHVHIGSGGDPKLWQQNIDIELGLIEKYFPNAKTVSFGGGLKEARMPDEKAADIPLLGQYAAQQIEAFYQRTGRKLHMEIEPGNYIIANSGYIVTEVLDKKQTGPKGFSFIIADGGMDVNVRPLLYGSRHPFYIISQEGQLLSSEFNPASIEASSYQAIIVGRCCESGDAQCLDEYGKTVPRPMAEPSIGDIVVIGGTGAYCSAMAPANYNSHTLCPEMLYTAPGQYRLIRKRQSLEQMIQNEI